MVLRLPTWHGLINPIGIDPEQGVLIPWAIGGWKNGFRSFAQSVAAAIPDAVAYETPETWSVRKQGPDGTLFGLSPEDLLGSSVEISAALARLAVSVSRADLD